LICITKNKSIYKYLELLSPFLPLLVLIGTTIGVFNYIGFNPFVTHFSSLWNFTKCQRIIPYSMRDITDVPRGEIKYGGSTSLASLGKNQDIYKEMKDKGRFNLSYVDPKNVFPGSWTGIQMLLHNDVDISLSSEYLNSFDEYKKQNENIKLEEREIASDSIAFYVSKELKTADDPKNGFRNLKISQLKEILTGKIKNWKDVGGQDLDIRVYVREGVSGTVNFIEKDFLKAPITKDNRMSVDRTTSSIELVRKDETHAGIGFASPSEVCYYGETIQTLSIIAENSTTPISPCRAENKKNTNLVDLDALEKGTYPTELKRSLLVVFNPGKEPSRAAGIAFCNMLKSNEGKDFVKKAGLIPLK
jgi:phosphate transport system substrate-binding protein